MSLDEHVQPADRGPAAAFEDGVGPGLPVATIADGLAAIRARWPRLVSPSQDAPLFLLAAGWRSGSTLLQRALTSGRMMWGEPYGHAWLFDSVAGALRAFTRDWPPSGFFFRGQSELVRTRTWVANLYPSPRRLLQAYLCFFDELFAAPARANGYDAWGLKEVRLSGDHACFLRWIYPQAKIVFLHRNPYEAFRSYAARMQSGRLWYNRWPDRPLTTREFARHWRLTVASFFEHADRIGAITVRYEDLVLGNCRSLEEYLGAPLNTEAFRYDPTDGPPPLHDLTPDDLSCLDSELKADAGSLGYFS